MTLRGFRFPCTLDYKVLDEDFSHNRAGLAYQERDVPTLVARDPSGDPLVVLFGYGCHPVTAGPARLFDPDYPGVAINHIKEVTGADAQFILGPAGDQNPPDEGRGFGLGPGNGLNYPGIGGGAMGVYGYLGHFKGRPVGTTDIGVEQLLVAGLTTIL